MAQEEMTRGALYLVWPGEDRTEAMLARSIASLTEVHPELPYHVERLESGTLLDKSRMFDLSPFDVTLYLDADTQVLGSLDYGFEKAARHGLACCICECPWAKRYPCFSGDEIEFNTGVMFFAPKSRRVFDSWNSLAPQIDSSIIFNTENGLSVMPCNDQASFAMAIEKTGFNPWILPLNWNFRPKWQKHAFGQIRIWHDYADVPAGVRRWNELQTGDKIAWEHESKTGENAIISCGQIA